MTQHQFLPHFSIRIIISFIFFTAIGTLSHEFGHMAVAKYFGYETTLSYGSMRYDYPGFKEDPIFIEYQKIWEENTESIKNKKEFDGQERYLELLETLKLKYPYQKPNAHWVMLGGPAQTILTSFLGLFILFYRKSKRKGYFVLFDWIGVFLSLFVLREVFNFIMTLYGFIFNGSTISNNDEFRISRYLNLNQWTIPTITMILGLAISLYVIFRVIPMKYRFTFIISGLIGGIAGFFMWLRFLGPIVLP